MLDLPNILNVLKGIRKHQENYHPHNELALKHWVESNFGNVLLYQPPDSTIEPKIPKIPFIFVFATNWMLKKLSKLGHDSAVAMDGTFGTNQYGVCADF